MQPLAFMLLCRRIKVAPRVGFRGQSTGRDQGGQMFEGLVDMDAETASDIIGRAGASLEHGQNVGLPDVSSG